MESQLKIREAKHEEVNSKKGEVMDCNNAFSVINLSLS